MATDEIQRARAIAQHSLQADQFAARYGGIDSDVYHSCFAYSRRRLDACLERRLPERAEGLRLLDVGCGTGHHLARLRARGFEVAGVDGSAAMLEHARALNPGADLRQADVQELPFADASFDFVLCVEVLRYLPDPTRCFQELARVLAPGGTCLATAAPLWNLNGYWLVNRIAHRVPAGNLVRLRQSFTTSRRLRLALIAAGFAAPEVHGVYLGPLNWVERLLPPALPRVLRAWEPWDATLADRPVLKEFSNMFLAVAKRGQRSIP